MTPELPQGDFRSGGSCLKSSSSTLHTLLRRTKRFRLKYNKYTNTNDSHIEMVILGYLIGVPKYLKLSG